MTPNKKSSQATRSVFIGSALALMVACGRVEDQSLSPDFDPASAGPLPQKPARAFEPNRQAFFGDLHVHTAYSYDAYTMGVRALPDDAYRFMRGAEIRHSAGFGIQLKQPLDFGAVTDHAEYLGMPRHLDGDKASSWADILNSGQPLKITAHYLYQVLSKVGSPETLRDRLDLPEGKKVSAAAWQAIIDAAEDHNRPGEFTTFIAYEWTSMPDSDNLHRNVIYRSDNVPERPFSSLDSENPEILWNTLDQQRAQGMDNMAIPHNGNVSNGRMYEAQSFNGEALDKDYARQRNRNEPISEILQVKGSSETHPMLSPDDGFAGFEIYDQRMRKEGGMSEPKGSYARDALRTGMELQHREGFNPFEFGVIGSSDSHNGSSSVEEDNYHGKLPLLDGSAGLRQSKTLLLPKDINRGARWSAQGLAGVWAEENTRESLFDAMRRRETFATSGPRIRLRFFAGWNFPQDILQRQDYLSLAYQQGVPMGSQLAAEMDSKQPGGPSFLLSAVKDPLGANLDRIQIIKLWIDNNGQSNERIYDVVASDNRRPDPDSHKVEPLPNTVDAKTATYTQQYGVSQLSTLWRDPDFNPDQQAAYYARVLQIPTPRYSTFDAKALGIEPPEPVSIQERAISSAIWYRP